jgi:hypothetical protein
VSRRYHGGLSGSRPAYRSRVRQRELPRGMCVNGCEAPVQAPSLVLCGPCLARLDAKIEALGEELERKHAGGGSR